MSKAGILYLIPVPIADESGKRDIPEYNCEVVKQLQHFIAEDAKTARRNLKLFGYANIQEADIQLLNEHNQQQSHRHLLQPLLDGKDLGLMSDAGCPGIADPGAEIVRLAHAAGVAVVALTGPSSIVLAIMASGFNGQSFAFNGYLPVDKAMREKRLRELQHISSNHGQAQFFIETPYRNQQLMQSMLACLPAETLLFIGRNIGGSNQFLKTASVKVWKENSWPDLHKVPVVFGIYAGK